MLLSAGFVRVWHLVLFCVTPASQFLASFTVALPEAVRDNQFTALVTTVVIVGFMLVFNQSVMSNVKLHGRIRWQAQFSERIIASVPVGMIGVRPLQTSHASRYHYQVDESVAGSLPPRGLFKLTFSNMLADKIFD